MSLGTAKAGPRATPARRTGGVQRETNPTPAVASGQTVQMAATAPTGPNRGMASPNMTISAAAHSAMMWTGRA
jgi:hypothetical protein